MTDVNHVFVYGTLKTGQARERMWPRKPVSISVATTGGVLYNLGPYPAMTAGADIVRGEAWEFEAGDLDATLKALDGIEGYRDQPDDLYKRVVIECEIRFAKLEAAGRVSAYTYHYAHELEKSQRVPPVGGVCEWLNS